MRIVSLLPSATDLLVALGAREDIIGVSHSCGDEWTAVPRLTRTWINTKLESAEIDEQVSQASQPLYELNIEAIKALAPDVIVSQSLCDVCAIPAGDVAAAIASLPSQPHLIDLAPQRLDDIPLDFEAVGSIIGRTSEARALTRQWEATFSRFYQKHLSVQPRIAFLDWLNPPFAAGHWVPDLIEWLGGVSVLAQAGLPSYKIDWSDIDLSNIDLVIAACCGFSKERMAQDLDSAPMDIVLLDGYQHFSRPSPILMESIELLDRTIVDFYNRRNPLLGSRTQV